MLDSDIIGLESLQIYSLDELVSLLHGLYVEFVWAVSARLEPVDAIS